MRTPPPQKSNGGFVWLCIIAVVGLFVFASASKPKTNYSAYRPTTYTPTQQQTYYRPTTYSTPVRTETPTYRRDSIAVAPINDDVYVRGYTRKDGTYVRPHYRTRPNRTKTDNYSYRGNINPYTGKRGSHR